MSVPTKPLHTRPYVILRIASIVVLMISALIVLAQALIVRSGAYHDESIVIVFMLAIIIGMVALVWRYGEMVEEMDRHKHRAENTLSESSARYHALFEYSNDAVIVLDADGHYIDANVQAEHLTGYTRDELLKLRVGDLSPEREVNRTRERLKILNQEGILHSESTLLRKDGTEISTETSTVMIFPGVYQSIMRDVSKRKQAEEALRASEARYRALFEHSGDAIVVLDQDGHYVDANSAMERMSGYTRDELMAKSLGDLTPAEEIAALGQHFKTMTEVGKSAGERVLLRKDGSKIIIDRLAVGVAPGIYQVTMRDISERKRAEEALRASEARYRTLFEYSSDAILIIDEQGHYVDANPQAERLTGYSHDEILHLKVGAMTPPQQADIAPKRLEAARNEGGWSGEGVLLRKDGSELIVEIAGVHVAPGLYQTIVHDINERKRAEEALRASEARYRALFENSSDAILIFDEQGQYLEANTRAEQLTGYSHDEILTKRVGQFAAHIPEGQAIFAEIRHSGQLQTDYTIARKDGREVAVVFSATTIAPGLYQSILHDISARKQVEESLRRSLEQERELNQLKSRFVSMVSHDFRTPLAVIQSSTDLLLSYADRMEPAKRQDRLEKIQLQIGRLVQMLDNILIIGKAERIGLEFRAERQNVGEFCAALVAELQLATPTHSIVFNSSGDCSDVAFDPKLLHQAFTNLVSNAVKYSPTDKPVVVDLACSESEVVVQVQDQGIGIPEEDQKHLFELFHRAQNVGDISGTGVGLSIVKQAVEAHRGTIEIDSKINMGTTFIIRFPRSQSA